MPQKQIPPDKPDVLVVDDDVDLLELIRLSLGSQGYTVRVSPNGHNFLDLITRRHPGLVFLDLSMNGVDGGTICRLIKDNSGTSSIPIILLSANENIESIAQNCGANGCIRKPFEMRRVKAEIARVLSEKVAG